MVRPTATGALRPRRAGAVLALVATVVAGVGCATKRPVLYPNQHLEQVGSERSKQDVAECKQLAKDADLEKSQVAEAAKSGGTGAVVGGAAGAVGGAIAGGAARGAGVGAAVGGVFGLGRWLFSASEPDPLFKSYVDTCLRERGYQVIGWK